MLYPSTSHPTTKRGLIALGLVSLLSLTTTAALLVFMSIRMARWRHHYKSALAGNQYIVLIMALLLSEFFYALSFSLSWYWYSKQGIDLTDSGHDACFAQGLFMELGDISSTLFILAIAAHTCFQVGLRRRLETKWFALCVIAVATLAVVMTIIGPIAYGRRVYALAGIWCFIAGEYQGLRLGTLYFWIFLTESLCIIFYGALWVKLSRARKSINAVHNWNAVNDQKIKRAAMLMAIYPVVYVTLTLPLASVRMALYAGRTVPEWAYIFAGTMMVSCGWVDCLLYVLTRRALLRDDFKSQSPASSAHPYIQHSPAGTDASKPRLQKIVTPFVVSE